jgi:putative colanic acid biosynthesis glycosyltransferase
MKVAQINTVCGVGSTGKICVSISKLLTEQGIPNRIFHTMDGRGYSWGEAYMSSSEVRAQALAAKVCGNYGFQSRSATQKLIHKLEAFAPDVVQLHNLHGHNVHLGMLFSYLKQQKIKTFWTFHDCWAFTGYCMYFDAVACDKWMTGCEDCPQRKKYSWCFDRSRKLYQTKKELLEGLDLTVITPSRWLADLVRKSFLGDYPVKVIHNGIDLTLFSPQDSNVREKLGIAKDKAIVLGVANKWEPRKGLDVFLRLAESLDRNKFQIVLVGTDDEVDRRLPPNVISIHRTANQTELAELYSAADVFVNPTREDNFPTVNLEALACGAPVITFDTGGSPEALTDECGLVIEQDDFEKLYENINKQGFLNFSVNACVCRASEFDQNVKFNEYIKLYGL